VDIYFWIDLLLNFFTAYWWDCLYELNPAHP
jgi:hypothetical protein